MFRLFVGLFIAVSFCFAACDPPIGCPDYVTGNFNGQIVRYEVGHPSGLLIVQLSCDRPQLKLYNKCGHCGDIRSDCILARGSNEMRIVLPAGNYRIEACGEGLYNLTTGCFQQSSNHPLRVK
ncbi:MAG: hypothetical protein KKF39_07210 [Nanoarchaeota archaeon]|nr:hypothetical protein [Nanoarchaeota archaeon]